MVLGLPETSMFHGIHNPSDDDMIFYARLGANSFIVIDPIVGAHYLMNGGEGITLEVNLQSDNEKITETIYILCYGERGSMPREMKTQVTNEFIQQYKNWL